MPQKNIDLTSQIEQILKGTINPLTAKKIAEYQKKKNGTVDLILNLCQAYTNHINLEQARISQPIVGGAKSIKVTKKDRRYTWAELNVYGARIIYLIRFLLHEEGTFFLISTSNEKTTKQALISQFEIMTHMQKVKGDAIGVKVSQLETALHTISNEEQTANKRINQWNLVKQLGTVERYNGLEKEEINAQIIYRNAKADQRVWVKFSGEKKLKTYYYNVGDKFVFYNIGWLYQWYNAILMGEDNNKYSEMVEGLRKKTIAPIIGEQENVSGTKTGDFQDAQGRQIQAKYRNNKIISYNNIKIIMVELTQALLAWKKDNNKETQKRLQAVLQEHFYPDAIQIGNETANAGFEQIENILKSKLSTSLNLIDK